jgi:hypothetical protein
MKRTRMYIPMILAILSIGMAGYKTFEDIRARSWLEPSSHMVTTWDQKIQPLRDFLPPDVMVVGYLDKSMVSREAGTVVNFDTEEFLLMQYSMAPVVLEWGADQPWIVGNFDNKAEFRPWLDENLGNYELESFGYSLYLIHKLDE